MIHRAITTAITIGILFLATESALARHHVTANASDNDGEEHARKAIAAMQLALPTIQNSTTNFCGHQADAVAAINNAVAQLQAAVACGTGKSLSYETHKKGNLPNVRAALKELKKVRKDLQNSKYTFCNNSPAALQATDAAIGQLQFVMDCK